MASTAIDDEMAIMANLPHEASFYCLAESILQEMSSTFVAMDDGERKKFVKFTEQIVKILIDDSREKYPSTFGELYDGVIPVGSFYDRLRVREPTEFDYNIVFDIPQFKITFDDTHEPDGYVKACVEMGPVNNPELRKKIGSWVDNRGRLLSRRLKSFLESISQHWSNFPELELKKSGPAMTAVIHWPSGSKEISIDFVPVIRIDGPTPSKFRKLTNNTAWYLVPKSYPCSEGEEKSSWRPSFPLQERNMLSHGKVKHVIRLLKRVRDALKFHGLSSYYVKTLFLWRVSDETLNWERDSLSYLFFTMLTVLKECLEEHRIPNYWCHTANLLENIRRETTKNWADRLRVILNRNDKTLAAGGVEAVRRELLVLFA